MRGLGCRCWCRSQPRRGRTNCRSRRGPTTWCLALAAAAWKGEGTSGLDLLVVAPPDFWLWRTSPGEWVEAGNGKIGSSEPPSLLFACGCGAGRCASTLDSKTSALSWCLLPWLGADGISRASDSSTSGAGAASTAVGARASSNLAGCKLIDEEAIEGSTGGRGGGDRCISNAVMRAS